MLLPAPRVIDIRPSKMTTMQSAGVNLFGPGNTGHHLGMLDDENVGHVDGPEGLTPENDPTSYAGDENIANITPTNNAYPLSDKKRGGRPKWVSEPCNVWNRDL